MPVEDGDWAVNVNHMGPGAYYPAHTDDWQLDPSRLPDIDGSGHHILTYSSTKALVLVAPNPHAAGVGAVGFVVDAGDIWGMRAPAVTPPASVVSSPGTAVRGVSEDDDDDDDESGAAPSDEAPSSPRDAPNQPPSARYNAVHAVLNLANAPRFSVNFRLGGFEAVFPRDAAPRGRRRAKLAADEHPQRTVVAVVGGERVPRREDGGAATKRRRRR